MMDLQINPTLLAPDTEDGGQVAAVDDQAPAAVRPTLPEGVYCADQTLPDGRTELFRANGRIYTLPTKASAKMAFRMMRRIRLGASEIEAMTGMLYDVLGDAVMDFLADEDLSEEQMDWVTDAISKYMFGAAKLAGLGKSATGPTR